MAWKVDQNTYAEEKLWIFGIEYVQTLEQVEDISKKRSLDLRLLYGVAYGHSWFGRWGYKFCRGSYGVTKSDYENAIELLGSLELDQVESDFNEHKQFKEVKQIFRYYRDMSEGRLKTLRDLLRFMLIIKSHAQQSSKLRAAVLPPTMESPHSKRSNRLFLKKSDAVENEKSSKRFRIYSDVAANLGSRWPVRRLEYAAEVIVESLKEMKTLNQNGMTRQDVRDAARLHMETLNTNVLLDYPESETVSIDPSLIDLRSEQINELPPGELVTVLLQATVFDLKQAIEDTFRDTYCILTNFTVNEIDELEEDDRNLLFGRVENCSALTVRGFGIEEIEAQVSRWVSYVDGEMCLQS
ncbi:unnamed protein product [Microthlaspi erraticum]|uniref:Uncharacterized protein n=1 Tax=Microthlaspi erraticum TaxID=1685480 RepID=A0A6D2IBK1_9BRAS|nr:unnamed protein product [Microthlaspi erraticum]